MKLSKRLQAIVACIPEHKRVLDVGCDHALLDIYLTLYHDNICIASDINSNVLEKTRSMLTMYHVEDKIQVIESDGLENIDVAEDDILVIAGMGAMTIGHILDNKLPNDIIIQSNNHIDMVREIVTEKGYLIVDETVIYEKGIYYVIICFQKGIVNYSKKELLYGPILLQKKDSIMISYWKDLLQKKQYIYTQVPAYEKQKLLEEIKWLEEILK